MNCRSFLLVLLILAAGAMTPLLVHHHGKARLMAVQDRLSAQARRLDELNQTNKWQPERASETGGGLPLSAEEVRELARLRNEARQLRETLQQRDRLVREKQRIEQALQNPSHETELENPTALLVDELPTRRARVTALHEWLEQNPKEKIPELGFLSEDSWIRSADRQRVTDEDFEGWMSAQRGNAEAKFGHMARNAVKAFAQANDGNFPKELAQLKPFFSQPIDDAILDRYKIVSSKTLPQFLAEVGDWAITQKAPINAKRDSRLAIGLKDRRGTVQEGRWDEEPDQ
ncbi:MAG: hypothetical protein JWM16_2471 [Verrucomicrobiales bacterium]|nr:hypothetical protein [Verrucomicrobiales bacterium]